MCTLTQNGGGGIEVCQKEQGKKLEIINANSKDYQYKYREQHARGAYIAIICQPEAAFDLSVAAQHQTPMKIDIKTLNKRLE
jgi:hypothetical protein